MSDATGASPKPRGTRTGFTTGACSAAAARAAVHGLMLGVIPARIESQLPNAQRVEFAVCEPYCQPPGEDGHVMLARAVVVKFAGDDPDCTDGARLTAELQRLPGRAGWIEITGGAGVGVVSLPGLGLPVGEAAINPKPRANIEANLREVAGSLLAQDGLRVIISVPGGEEMARKTHNARLGILGGISILGTTGIVKPYSTAAWRASVVQGVQLAASLGQRNARSIVVLTTGGRTEQFAMREYADLAPGAFVQMGDFLRYALDEAAMRGIRQVVIAAMVGKLTKIAQGETITHANRAEVDTRLLAELAAGIGASAEDCTEIEANPTARFAAERMAERGLHLAFHQALAERTVHTLCDPQVGRYAGRFALQVLVCDFDGQKICAAHSAAADPQRANLPLQPVVADDEEQD
ncbi:cobalt-precorrin-5B (C(1))-methyltransferase [Uliginosibacterium sp. 31-12]|uniref:cobalt-precorrin-5B (C(1))-methyltransferase n=1 Tax=Uliginosibacterium sp. 31-12 TaxID=3062781 RepID=UPI0026E2BA6F|nr:cobalt-precorrin-5B (C(1))-methyltransferase [Uliginosibacterium sp. 31-12]MDO6385285.1 cobalt-precorrin-5B (C(1))-methyltransferase [Uliginosibacterium sp. 31-12]